MAGQEKHFAATDNVRDTEFVVKPEAGPAMDELELAVNFSSVAFNRRRALFQPKGKIETHTHREENMDVFTVDNGVMRYTIFTSCLWTGKL